MERGLMEEDEFQYLLTKIPDMGSHVLHSEEPDFAACPRHVEPSAFPPFEELRSKRPPPSHWSYIGQPIHADQVVPCLPDDQSVALALNGLCLYDEPSDVEAHESAIFGELENRKSENSTDHLRNAKASPLLQQQCNLNAMSPTYVPNQSFELPGLTNWNIQQGPYLKRVPNRAQAHRFYAGGPSYGDLQSSMPISFYANGDCCWEDVDNRMNFPAFNGGYYLRDVHKETDRECKISNGKKFSSYQRDFLGHKSSPNKSFPEKILTRSHGVNSVISLCPAEENRLSMISNGGGDLFHLNEPLGYANFDPKRGGESFRGLSLSSSVHMEYSVDYVLGRVFDLAKDQHGCRFLQRIFAEARPGVVERIFLEVIDDIVELMTDPFGNYFVQKLLEVCNLVQRIRILRNMTSKAGELFRISCDMHGTRVVQKVIETLQTEEQYSIVVSSLKPEIVGLMKNVNGNHVAQKCLQNFPLNHREFLYDAATDHCVELAMNRQGCCVLQKCIDKGEESGRLISAITSNSLHLSQDQFGNYVVQYVLDKNLPWATAGVHNQLEGNYASISMQKYSSNVVEKFLKLPGEAERTRIVQELMSSRSLLQVLQDPFGNYVIQSALRECKGALRTALIDAIRPHFRALRSNAYGKKVLLCNCLRK